jgi:hypothetical protein
LKWFLDFSTLELPSLLAAYVVDILAAICPYSCQIPGYGQGAGRCELGNEF